MQQKWQKFSWTKPNFSYHYYHLFVWLQKDKKKVATSIHLSIHPSTIMPRKVHTTYVKDIFQDSWCTWWCKRENFALKRHLFSWTGKKKKKKEITDDNNVLLLTIWPRQEQKKTYDIFTAQSPGSLFFSYGHWIKKSTMSQPFF